jgi:hypothetical protein
MTCSDLIYVLEHLRFQGRGREALGVLKVDREVATFLIHALRRRRAPLGLCRPRASGPERDHIVPGGVKRCTSAA